ncbi:endonuclease VII domain-containing protein [Micromonospora sp. NPDC005173]|uniref:endonuclease VII domain-containing protein n=1 Tax=Micromonospora sp. NPDC005173 TaxID=3157165 RepID=UPI0033A0BB67
MDVFQKRMTAAGGLSSTCRDCLSLARVTKAHNLPVIAYLDLLASQGGVCAICKEPPGASTRLVVDHRHSCCPTRNSSCGKCVRGLLCGTCNAAIGLFREDPEIFRRAIAYKQQWSAPRGG